MIPANSIILHDNKTRQWLYFEDPVKVYEVHDPALLLETLREIEQTVDENNLYAAGFLSYEAASGINPVLSTKATSDFPLCWFGLYETPMVINEPVAADTDPDPDWQPSITPEQYYDVIREIRRKIHDGETYQVNFSYRLHTQIQGDPQQLFAGMVAAQGPGYSALVELPGWSICSASPELFFALEGDVLSCCPMKGTFARGLTLAEDRKNHDWLYNSAKNRAENLMIVDMVRNDLGRIAETGTVKTASLFDIEKYPTVWQMTSTVQCRTKAGLSAILQALYPAASITGAPKRHTMEIIRETEYSPRNIYTGTIGYYAPNRRAQFNVAIRTVLIDKRRQWAEYGVGGGIVWDSDEKNEFMETHSKAGILTFNPPEFDLLETVCWLPEAGFWLLNHHLSRLKDSAEYFSRPCDENKLMQELERHVAGLSAVPYRVRILLNKHGNFNIEVNPVNASSNPYRLGLARQPVDSRNVFLYHKTTHRKVYEDACADLPDYDDVLLWNERGEITETCIANIIVEINGELVTPPVDCGLLAGTYRTELLQQRKISERVIRVDELKDCSRFYLVNSVRGWWEVEVMV